LTPSSVSSRARSAVLVAVTAGLLVGASACSGIASDPSVGASRAAGRSASGGVGPTDPAGSASGGPAPSVVPPVGGRSELPQGGTTVFPAYRLFGFSGVAGSGPNLGRIGVGNLDDRVTEMASQGQQYAAGRKVLPTLELIATVVQKSPGADGMYRTVSSDDKVRVHLEAVRRVKGILLLAIQPGRSDFVTEVKRYETWLKEPDVGVALDPEWRMGPTQVPMRVFGSTTGQELDDTAAYLSKLVTDNGLPEKVMLYHMLRTAFVTRPQDLRPHPGVTQVVSVDGIGAPSMKIATWKRVMKVKPAHVHPGFKLFFTEDTAQKGWRLMTANEVLGLTPTPEYILFE
jgi:hypothetical protein